MLVVTLAYSVTAVLSAFLAILLYLWHWREIRVYWMIRDIQSPSSVPVVGDAIFAARRTTSDLVAYIRGLSDAGSRYFKTVRFGLPSVFFFHPDDLEVILSSTQNIKKGHTYLMLKSWLKEGLLVSDGDKWRQRRKLLTPTFHFRILDDNVGKMVHHTKTFVQTLLQSNGKPIVLENVVKKLTLEVICETAMGIDLNVQNDKGTDYVNAVQRLTDTVAWRTMNVWMTDTMFSLTELGRRYKKDLKVLHAFSQQVIQARKIKFEEENNIQTVKIEKKRKAFLDLLLEEDKNNPGVFTFEDIQEEVDTFMFEGHDTTAAALIHAIYLLAEHPKVQEEVYDEQQKIFGCEDREPTRQDLQEMVYLEMVIKETLRLFPSVPLITRRITHDMTMANGKVIPAGITAVIMPYLVHRHKLFWESPDEFRPERFLPGTPRHPYAYIPFSAGSRNCIGMKFAMLEMKAALSSVVRSCRIEAVETNLNLLFSIILKNKTPIEVKIFPRVK